MKLDIKTLIILVLLVISLGFCWNWFFGGGKAYKKQVKELEKERTELLLERKTLISDVDSLIKQNKRLITKDSVYKAKISGLDVEITYYKSKAENSKRELDRIKGELSLTRKKIKELKAMPPNREGDDLLNSLKLKLQK